MTTRILLLALLLAAPGCVHYSSRHINLDQTVDKTSFWSFLYVGSAGKIKSDIRQGTNYTRSVSVGNVSGKPDADFVEALAAGVARGTVEGAKKSGGIP